MSSYQERKNSLFNQLKDAEEQFSYTKSNKAEDPKDYGVIDKQSYRKLKKQMKQFRGQESIFKRPEAKLRECLRSKTKPDYMKNPQNWTYYSLADVTQEQMSDATNTATALTLMRELEQKDSVNKESPHQEIVTDETGAVFKKPMFQASKTIKSSNSSDEKQIIFKKDKVIMPEYVVGVSQKKEKKKPIVKNAVTNEKKVELKLNHLYEDDTES